MELELIADYGCVTGENPLWHPDEQRVYWTDIPTGRMFRYEPATGAHEQFYEGEVVGGFTIQDDGALLLFMAHGAVRTWRDGTLTTLIEEIPAERPTRFNDVIADPHGRVFCGTISPRFDEGERQHPRGRLYRLDPDLTLTVLLEGVGVSNGMGFTPDRRSLYYTDTPTREISLFDYDEATGGLTNRRRFVSEPTGEGRGAPDGMTVDAEGCVWSAHWGGSCLVRYAPDGTELLRVQFPARKVSCPTFGGPDYSDLYVTTAGGQSKDVDGPGAGALYRLRPGVRGVPEHRSRIGRG
ncbi:MAG: SMP-30/gluconolactonase/LRE family protein [Chloroflexi bacterium]|nr:SMP-30/gluconolactonase/LRE family protein [Chloroflexota bacterium]